MLHDVQGNSEIVKRWTNEIQEAQHNVHSMVQFHAVALLHALRANDRLAVSKLVSDLIKSSVRSPLAQCLLVRYVAQVCHSLLLPSPLAWQSLMVADCRDPPGLEQLCCRRLWRVIVKPRNSR